MTLRSLGSSPRLLYTVIPAYDFNAPPCFPPLQPFRIVFPPPLLSGLPFLVQALSPGSGNSFSPFFFFFRMSCQLRRRASPVPLSLPSAEIPSPPVLVSLLLLIPSRRSSMAVTLPLSITNCLIYDPSNFLPKHLMLHNQPSPCMCEIRLSTSNLSFPPCPASLPSTADVLLVSNPSSAGTPSVGLL